MPREAPHNQQGPSSPLMGMGLDSLITDNLSCVFMFLFLSITSSLLLHSMPCACHRLARGTLSGNIETEPHMQILHTA
jgi:hypothetical protein